jgi:hypothetical protein
MKTLVSLIVAAALFAVNPAAAADQVKVPNLVGMKNGNDVIAILNALKLKWTFNKPRAPGKPELQYTIADQSYAAGTLVPEGTLVVVTAYGKFAPPVTGLPLHKATRMLEDAGFKVGGVEVVTAPSGGVADTVAWQSVPDENGNIALSVYAPYYPEGSEPQESTATQPSTGAGAGGGGGLAAAGCRSTGKGLVIVTGVDTPCSYNVGAVFGADAMAAADWRLEGQASHGKVEWSNGILTYTPAPGYKGPDSFTMSSQASKLVGQQVVFGREKMVWKVDVQ